jgi:hypothetical protein
MTTVQLPIPRSTFPDVVGAERIKFATLRSNVVLVAIVAALIAVSGALSALALVTAALDPQNVDPMRSAEPLRFLDTVLWMQVVFSIVAVLFATTEYSSRQIMVTLIAVPTRVPVLLAKAVNIAVVGFVAGVLGASVAVTLPILILPSGEIEYRFQLAEAGVLVLAAGAYLALTGVVALSVGALIRNVAVAILVPTAVFTFLPSVLQSIGNETITTLTGLLPSMAGRVILSSFESPAGLSGEWGMAVLAAWAVGLLAIAAWVLRARDA